MWITSRTLFAIRQFAYSKSPNQEIIAGPAVRAHVDVLARSQVVGFKKSSFLPMRTSAPEDSNCPENEMQTTTFWLTLGHGLLASLPFSFSARLNGIFGLLYALGSMATLLRFLVVQCHVNQVAILRLSLQSSFRRSRSQKR
jgi:hypothetical protein